jgi:hypothetical protein
MSTIAGAIWWRASLQSNFDVGESSAAGRDLQRRRTR